ncbi:MAG TPA: PIG-L family deacetylase [Longimicrobiales bacterium]|nr:PIG-L family deacetylase [Longimicrobiales bacterium]
MSAPLRLVAVLAHPDDESLGFGGTFARYAAEGVETYLVTATRGERGRYFDNENRPPDEEVGRVRELELRGAAHELGIRHVSLLGYCDGELDSAPTDEAVGRIVSHLRELRPHVVISFGFDGAYGHPDHIAISQLTTSAIVAAADPTYRPDERSHRVAKLYHLGWPRRIWELYQQVFKKLISVVDGEERAVNPWPEWTLTTRIDAREHWQTAWRAIRRHETQLAVYQRLDDLTEDQHATLWGDQHFCRVFSTVNSGRHRETDLFEGLR